MNFETLNGKAKELLTCKNSSRFSSLSLEFLELLKKSKFKNSHRDNKEDILQKAQNLFGFHKFNPSEITKKEVKKEINFLLDLVESDY